MRSGEWNMVQEAIQAAVTASMNQGNIGYPQCREELEGIRGELKGEFGTLRVEIRDKFAEVSQEMREVRADLAEGKTSFALLNQRMDQVDVREQNKRNREREDTPTRGHRHRSERPDPDDAEDKPLVPPRIVNTLILTLVACAGASIWALGSAWLSAKSEPAKASVSPSATPAATTGHTP